MRLQSGYEDGPTVNVRDRDVDSPKNKDGALDRPRAKERDVGSMGNAHSAARQGDGPKIKEENLRPFTAWSEFHEGAGRGWGNS
jgi:hypothetical protein